VAWVRVRYSQTTTEANLKLVLVADVTTGYRGGSASGLGSIEQKS
jgi:hypothetical protein